MNKISIVIVNYNTKDLLIKCLQNLYSIDSTYEVIVVDNGSVDGSAYAVKSEFPQVIIVETQNHGLAAGSNKGLEKATGEYILYLGTDALPEKDTIPGMLDFLDKSANIGVATCKLVLRDGSLDMDAHRGFPTPWAALTHFSKLNKVFPDSKIFNQYFLGYKNMDVPHEIDLCISHFMLIRREVFNRVGRWDEDYFVYGEDVDFCYRVKEAGWKVVYLPQWKTVHYKGATVGIRKETKDIVNAATQNPETKERMLSETTKAMRIFYEKHYSKKYPRFIRNLVYKGIDYLELMRNRKP